MAPRDSFSETVCSPASSPDCARMRADRHGASSGGSLMTKRLSGRLRLAVAATALLAQSCATAPPEQQAQLTRQQAFEQDRAGPQLLAYADGVHSKANERDLGIASLDVAVNVRGDIAETTVTVAFENPTANILEGQFALNMTRGAVVTGYALDINGTLIDG
ncbi:MAG: hypothetical protein EON61_20135, partial [Alphaproteobacteria bacterium]